MARTLITPVKSSEMTTAPAAVSSTANCVVFTTAGAYIKTGGTSNIDASRLVFVLSRNSSKCSTAYSLVVRAGSTAGKKDFEPGPYATARDLVITIPATTNVYGGTSGNFKALFFTIPETSRFKDTDGYIKLDMPVRTGSSATHASIGTRLGAIYLKP